MRFGRKYEDHSHRLNTENKFDFIKIVLLCFFNFINNNNSDFSDCVIVMIMFQYYLVIRLLEYDHINKQEYFLLVL